MQHKSQWCFRVKECALGLFSWQEEGPRHQVAILIVSSLRDLDKTWVLTLLCVSLQSSVDVWLSHSAHYFQEHSGTMANFGKRSSYQRIHISESEYFLFSSLCPGHVSSGACHVSSRPDSEAGESDQWRDEDCARDDGGHGGWRGHGQHGGPPRPGIKAPGQRLVWQMQAGLKVLLPGRNTLQVKS